MYLKDVVGTKKVVLYPEDDSIYPFSLWKITTLACIPISHCLGVEQ